MKDFVATSTRIHQEADFFFNNGPYLLCIASAEDGHFKDLNPAWEKTLGFTKEELLSKPFIEFIHPDDRASSMSAVENYRKGQPNDDLENRFICKDGSYKWLSWTATQAKGTLIYGIAREITEYKKASEKLKESAYYLDKAQEIAHIGFWKLDPSTQRIEGSDELFRIFGFKKSESLFDEFAEIVHPEDREYYLGKIRRGINYKERWDLEYRLKFKDGTLKWIHAMGEPILDEAGRVVHLVGTVQDITKRNFAENAVFNIAKAVSSAVGDEFFFLLAENLAKILEADYAYIAEIVQDKPNFVKTLSLIADGTPVDNIEVNLAGTPCETILNSNIHTYPFGVQERFPEAFMMAKMNVEGYAGILLSSSSGKKLGLMAIMCRTPIKNISIVESVLKIFAERASSEIERRHSGEAIRKAKEEIEAWNKELEKRVIDKTEALIKSQSQLVQSEKLSAMGKMAGGLAHELNSPLAGLLPMIEKFRDGVEEDTEEYLELTYMLKACDHMARIIKDFGVFSRDSKGIMTALNLNELIEDTLSFSIAKLKHKGIKVVKEYSDALPLALGIRTELQQVILNMVTNSGDATPAGGEIIIRTGRSENGRMVKMEFIDNGTGIQKKDLDRIFDPFYTTKKEGEGIGLGLSVTYGIIKKHSGEISVESAPGKGTHFTITLPVLESAHP